MISISKEGKKNLKLLGIGILFAALVFVLGNWDYLWQNLKYSLHKPEPVIVEVQKTGPPDVINIPSLEITAPVKYAQATTEKEFQTLLLDGVVHYPGTAMPGQAGNDYIFGHSSDYIWSKGHYKTVFALLPKISIGDMVSISDSKGNQFTYKVIETKIVSPSDLTVLNQDTAGKKLLTVQTSYPVGTALKRFLAICEIVSN